MTVLHKSDMPDEWYHASRDPGVITDGFDPDKDPFGSERESSAPKHWNAHLGTHFTSRHDTVHEIAYNHGGRIYHAQLGFQNPKHYESERDLDNEAYDHHVTEAGEDISAYPSPEDALTAHPRARELAHNFKRHLESQGHDGITYGNEYERPLGHLCAIAFHPEQIHVTEHHLGHEACSKDSAHCEDCGSPIDTPMCNNCGHFTMLSSKTASEDYRMQHTAPGPDDAPLHDLTSESAGVYPDDVYTHPHYYAYGPSDHRSMNIAHRLRGKPDAKVRIYRALPPERAHEGIHPGDWVSIDRGYARDHGRHPTDPKQDWPVISASVPAKHVHTAGDSISEWGYNGPSTVGATGKPLYTGPTKDFSFSGGGIGPRGTNKVRINAWDPEGNYAGHVTSQDGTIEEHHVEPQHAETDLGDRLLKAHEQMPKDQEKWADVVMKYAADEQGLPNPYHSDDDFHHTWFHGMTKMPDDRRAKGMTNALDSPSYYQDDDFAGPGRGHGGPQMNKLLGTHFSAIRSVAKGFAKDYADSDVYNARLKMKNPAYFPNEHALDRHIFRHVMENHPEFANDEKFASEQRWQGGSTPRQLAERDRQMGDDDGESGHHSGRTSLDQAMGSILPWHPQQREFAKSFTDSLRAQGHDGIVYGNMVEGPKFHHCAIAFHPDDIDVQHIAHLPESPQGGDPAYPWHRTESPERTADHALDESFDRLADIQEQHHGSRERFDYEHATRTNQDHGPWTPYSGKHILTPYKMAKIAAWVPQVDTATARELGGPSGDHNGRIAGWHEDELQEPHVFRRTVLPVRDLNAERDDHEVTEDPYYNEQVRDAVKAGTVDPVVATRTPYGYSLLDGHHRVRIAHQEGVTHIPAWLHDAGIIDHRKQAARKPVRRDPRTGIEMCHKKVQGFPCRFLLGHAQGCDVDWEAAYPDEPDDSDDSGMSTTAGLNGDLPDDLRLEHGESDDEHWVTAHADGKRVGELRWTKHDLDPDTAPIEISRPLWAGHVTDVDVHPDYQRRGIASAMWQHAKGLGVEGPEHSPLQTDEGAEWARRTSAISDPQRQAFADHFEQFHPHLDAASPMADWLHRADHHQRGERALGPRRAEPMDSHPHQDSIDPYVASWARRAVIARDLSFEFHPAWETGDKHHYLEAFRDGQGVGGMLWKANSGEVRQVTVGPEHRRTGVASALWEHAHNNLPEDVVKPQHSSYVTDDGDAWISSLGSLEPTYRHRYGRTGSDEEGEGIAEALHPETGEVIGALRWDLNSDPATVIDMSVDEAHRRKGIGRRLFDLARQQDSSLTHSDVLTDDGRQFRDALEKRSSAEPTYTHYSDHEFSPGDVVKPSSETGRKRTYGYPFAYLSGQVYFAGPGHDAEHHREIYGRHAYEVKPQGEVSRDPEYTYAGLAKDRPERDEDVAGYHSYMAPSATVVRKISTSHEAAVRDVSDAASDGDGITQGIMIALVPPEDLAARLQVEGGEDPEQIHLTLAYLGQTGEYSAQQLADLQETVAAWAEAHEPLSATVQGSGTFVKAQEEGQHVLWASVDAPGLERLHVSLVDYLLERGYHPRMNHVFVPHMTLAYEKHHVRFLPKIERETWTADEVWVCIAGRWESVTLGSEEDGHERTAARGKPRRDESGRGGGDLAPGIGQVDSDPLGTGQGTPRSLILHPKAEKDISRLHPRDQQMIRDTMDRLSVDDPTLQTHPLQGRLQGWSSTKASRGHRIVHQPREGAIHVGWVGLHDYGNAINRLSAMEEVFAI